MTNDELKDLMSKGSFFPEPTEPELTVTTKTPTISIITFGREESHITARKQLNQWLKQWDFLEAKDIVMRLTSEDDQPHQSALWELYLNSLFRSLGYSVSHEPLSGASSGAAKITSPDFKIDGHGESFLVEAVTISRTPSKTNKKLWRDLLSYLEEHTRADYWIGINPIASSDAPPKMRKILLEINEYLDSYSPPDPEVIGTYEFDRFTIKVEGWEFELHAHRVPEGLTLKSFVGMSGNLDGGAITDTGDLRSQILYKRSKYGADLPHKLVIAVLENSFMGGLDDHHRKAALFGEEFVTWNPDGTTSSGRHPNGIWNNGKVDTRLLGLLLLSGMRFGAQELHLPQFWANPYGDQSVDQLFPMTTWKANGNQYEKIEGIESWNPLIPFSEDGPVLGPAPDRAQ
jgi:hypothetical protein